MATTTLAISCAHFSETMSRSIHGEHCQIGFRQTAVLARGGFMYLSEPQPTTSSNKLVDSSYGDGANLQGLGDACGSVCRALQSLEKSAERLCSLAGPSSPRCINARQMFMRARARAIASGCNCQAAAPPAPRPVVRSGFGEFGQLTLPPRPRPSLLQPGPQL